MNLKLFSLLLCLAFSPNAYGQYSSNSDRIQSEANARTQTINTVKQQQTDQQKAALKTKDMSPSSAFILDEMKGRLAIAKIANSGKTPEVDDMIGEIAKTYRRLPSDSVAIDLVMQQALEEYYTGSAYSKSAAQASQSAVEAAFKLNLVQVAQNQRIIELLQILVTRK